MKFNAFVSSATPGQRHRRFAGNGRVYLTETGVVITCQKPPFHVPSMPDILNQMCCRRISKTIPYSMIEGYAPERPLSRSRNATILATALPILSIVWMLSSTYILPFNPLFVFASMCILMGLVVWLLRAMASAQLCIKTPEEPECTIVIKIEESQGEFERRLQEYLSAARSFKR